MYESYALKWTENAIAKLIPKQTDFCGRKAARNNQVVNIMYNIKKEDNKKSIREPAEHVKWWIINHLSSK